MENLFGIKPNQVPQNMDLGDLAYKDEVNLISRITDLIAEGAGGVAPGDLGDLAYVDQADLMVDVTSLIGSTAVLQSAAGDLAYVDQATLMVDVAALIASSSVAPGDLGDLAYVDQATLMVDVTSLIGSTAVLQSAAGDLAYVDQADLITSLSGVVNAADADTLDTHHATYFQQKIDDVSFIKVGESITESNVYINLHADSVNPTYSSRIYRASGQNGALSINNAGTGNFNITGAGALITTSNTATTINAGTNLNLNAGTQVNVNDRSVFYKTPVINISDATADKLTILRNDMEWGQFYWKDRTEVVTHARFGLNDANNCTLVLTAEMTGNATDSNLTFDVDGNLTISGAYFNGSDIRLKENIEVIPDALDKVCKLRGITYNFIGNPLPKTGLIAQEVQEVMPQLVTELPKRDGDDERYLGISYAETVGLLVEAIKELNEKVKALELK